MGTTPMKSRLSAGSPQRPRAAPRSHAFQTQSTWLAIVAALTLTTGPVSGQSWRVESTLSAQETVTNNVDLAPNDIRQSDWITELTPSLRVSEKGARTRLSAFLSLPVVLYARSGGAKNSVYPSADALGDIALIDNWLHVEGQVLVAQQYFSPFGAQPLSVDSFTNNRYRTQSYRVSPYVQGTAPGNATYDLRNNNVWTNASGAPVRTNSFHYTQFTGSASKTDTRIGWRAEFDVNDLTISDAISNADTFRTRLVRLQPLYNVDPQVRLLGTVGYEEDDFPLQKSSNAIYGAGFEWRPTPRTDVVASWEHRFFGGAYLFSFDHRMPLSVWKVQASRNITTSPQLLASVPAGGDVATLLNGLFLAAIPDPVERQQTIDQFISDRGLSPTLTGPVNLYSEQALLQQSQSASIGLLGVRNTVLLTIFNVDTEPIAASGNPLPPALARATSNRQTGASLLWSHKLSPSLVIDATIERFHTIARAPFEGSSNQTALRLVASTPLSAKTTMFAGARYQTLSSDVVADYIEAAAFVGVVHKFK